MADPRVERMGDVLARYSLALQPGDVVIVDASELAAPLLRAFYAAALQRGANPLVRVALSGLDEDFLRLATDVQLAYLSPLAGAEAELADATLRISAPANTRALTSADPARVAAWRKAAQPLMRRRMERAGQGDLRWSVTLFPTNAGAQEAEMSLTEYEDFVYSACLLDQPDPVAAWQAVHDHQQRLCDRLARVRQLRVVSEGTDLTLSIAGRTWMNSDGHRNFPSGEVFTGPVEDSAEGHISFSFPGIYLGRSVEGVRLEFEQGRVVNATAAKGQDLLTSLLDMDAGARFLGEFAFGTNAGIQRHTRNILFDEKIGGTVHLALGASYPDTGGTNQSALHWDLIRDLRGGGDVYADGELIYRNGAFLEN
ncbi:MAG: aminopeptidase [Chloroflexi bacterium]|nr:aminopeptidase [Chloroflexota bacterium]